MLVLWATHGGLSQKLCAVIENVCPMSIYRLICSVGRSCRVRLLTRCHLSLPAYFIADEKHSHCLAERVYLPTIVCGRVIWHLGYTPSKSVKAFAADYGEFKQAALAIDPSYHAKGILTDGFNSTKKSLSQLFPVAKIANCMLHATFKLPAQMKRGDPSGSPNAQRSVSSNLLRPKRTESGEQPIIESTVATIHRTGSKFRRRGEWRAGEKMDCPEKGGMACPV